MAAAPLRFRSVSEDDLDNYITQTPFEIYEKTTGRIPLIMLIYFSLRLFIYFQLYWRAALRPWYNWDLLAFCEPLVDLY